jgi:hypothetical protein
VLALPGLGTPTPTVRPPSPTPGTLAVGPLQLGAYVADPFRPSFRFTIDDPDWLVYRVYPDALGLQYDGSPSGRLDVGQVPLLYGDACIEGDPQIATGTSADDLITALQTVPYLQVGEVRAAEISGSYAVTVDVTVDPGAQAACGGFGADGVAVFPVADDVWKAVPGEVFRLRAVDIEATTVSFVMSADSASDSPVVGTQEFFERAERIIQSVEF